MEFEGMTFYTNKRLKFSAQEGKSMNWNKVAKRIPGRSNKDCRKRFYNEVTGGLKKVGFQRLRAYTTPTVL
jgi:Myb-like DNA-binding domain